MLRVPPWLLVVLAVSSGACRRPRDPYAVERLVPLSALDAGSGRPARPDAGGRGVVPVARGSSPEGVLGTRWGMARAELQARHRAAGGPCRDSGEYLFCPRPLVPVEAEVLVSYEFCADRLCAVALDGTGTRDEARLQREHAALVARMRVELGEPGASVTRVAPGCSGHLALCLGARRAELAARWRWSDGAQVLLSAEQDEDDALKAMVSLTCLSGDRVRRGVPDPDALDAGAHGAAGAPDGGT